MRLLRLLAAPLLLALVVGHVGGTAASPVVVRVPRERDAHGPVPIQRSGKWGYISPSGDPAIALQFDDAHHFYEGRAAVRLGARWGYIDVAGRTVIPPRFSFAARFSDGLAHVQWTADGGRQTLAYVDTSGRVVVRCDPGDPDVRLSVRCGRPFHEGYVAEAVEVFRCLDEPGNPTEYPCKATLIDRWGYYDAAGRLALPGPYRSGAGRFSDGVAPVQRYDDKLIGFINRFGEFVIRAEFDQARPFNEGLAAVRVGTAWGFIDRSGRRAITPRFQSVSDFSGGHAAARIDGRWGYIDRSGRFVIAPRYQEAGAFSEGRAAVCCDGPHTRYIDKAGRWAFNTLVEGGTIRNGLFIDGIALVELPGIGESYIDRTGTLVTPVTGNR